MIQNAARTEMNKKLHGMTFVIVVELQVELFSLTLVKPEIYG